MRSKRTSSTFAFAAVLAFWCVPAFAQQFPSAPAKPLTDQLPDSPTPTTPMAAKPEPDQPQSSSSSTQDADLPKPEPRIAANPSMEVTVLEDTLLRVRTNAPLSTSMTHEGAPVLFTLSQDVTVDNVLIIPRGATVHGTVVQSKKAGVLNGSPDLILKLISLELGGRTYPVYSYQFKVEGASKTRPTVEKIEGGAVVGALAGEVFGTTVKGATTAVSKLASAGAGAAVGAGLGALASAASSPAVNIPAEAELDFYLASPISVLPPTAQDAEHLSHLLHAGGPALYVRGETP